jgi:hypothetical protein
MLETGICGVQIGCTCIESDKIRPAERARSKSEPRAALQHVESSAIEFRLIETVLGELGAGDPSGMPMTTKLPTGSIGRSSQIPRIRLDGLETDSVPRVAFFLFDRVLGFRV